MKLSRPGPRLEPETDEEKTLNNEALQATVEAFLQSLGQCKAAKIHKDGVKLSLYARLPKGDIRWEHRYADSVLELTNSQRFAQRHNQSRHGPWTLRKTHLRSRHLYVAGEATSYEAYRSRVVQGVAIREVARR